MGMDKKSLSERDICTKMITPALRAAGWDEIAQIREEVGFTNGHRLQIFIRIPHRSGRSRRIPPVAPWVAGMRTRP